MLGKLKELLKNVCTKSWTLKVFLKAGGIVERVSTGSFLQISTSLPYLCDLLPKKQFMYGNSNKYNNEENTSILNFTIYFKVFRKICYTILLILFYILKFQNLPLVTLVLFLLVYINPVFYFSCFYIRPSLKYCLFAVTRPTQLKTRRLKLFLLRK